MIGVIDHERRRTMRRTLLGLAGLAATALLTLALAAGIASADTPGMTHNVVTASADMTHN
jgi:hypothetical protein